MGNLYLSCYSTKEKRLMQKYQKIRAILLLPILKILQKLGISSDMVSYTGFFMLIGFIYYVESNPIYASIFLLLHVLIDSLDGPLARLNKTSKDSGAFTDMVCDHFGMAIVLITLIYINLVNPVLAAIYIFLYIVMIIFIILRNKIQVPINYVFRSRFWVYIFYAIFAFSGINYLDYALIVFNLLMLPPVFASYFVIKKNI